MLVCLMFHESSECEDVATSVTIACGDARWEDSVWNVSQTVPISMLKVGFRPLPLESNGPEDDLPSILPEGMEHVLGTAEANPDKVCPLLIGVYAKEGDPRSGSIQAVSVQLEDPQVPPKTDMSSPATLKAKELSSAVATKLKHDPSFRKCRQLLFKMQHVVGTKGVVWLRNVLRPAENGFLARDLKAVTPKTMKLALQATQTYGRKRTGGLKVRCSLLSIVVPAIFHH